ncbi:MAG: hypothetical protein WAW17_04010, partial [Rhodococcus sp. (in: high G+C Gram-positive bacteria)]
DMEAVHSHVRRVLMDIGEELGASYFVGGAHLDPSLVPGRTLPERTCEHAVCAEGLAGCLPGSGGSAESDLAATDLLGADLRDARLEDAYLPVSPLPSIGAAFNWMS